MLIEQRMIIGEDFENKINDIADIISFGSESCFSLVPNINDYKRIVNVLHSRNLQVKLVTPRIAQYELEKIKGLIYYIVSLKESTNIVINDWGFLFFCSQFKEKLNISLGRQLCRTIVDCPWYKYILDNEESNIQEMLSRHPIDHLTKLDILKEWGVEGLEINTIHGIEKSIERLIKNEMKIIIHCEDYLLTVGRTCLGRRILNGKGNCKTVCGTEFDIEPNSKWLSIFDNQEPFSSEEKRLLSGMKISGNRVLLPQKSGIKEIIDMNLDTIIASRNITLDNLKKIISKEDKYDKYF